MATGLLQSGGVFEWPAQPELGYETWAQMSGMQPSHPLVGGYSGRPGYGGFDRQVAIADNATARMVGSASGAPASGHYSEIMNLKGNPIGWVLIAAILFLGLMHIHVKAGASGGFGVGKL